MLLNSLWLNLLHSESSWCLLKIKVLVGVGRKQCGWSSGSGEMLWTEVSGFGKLSCQLISLSPGYVSAGLIRKCLGSFFIWCLLVCLVKNNQLIKKKTVHIPGGDDHFGLFPPRTKTQRQCSKSSLQILTAVFRVNRSVELSITMNGTFWEEA